MALYCKCTIRNHQLHTRITDAFQKIEGVFTILVGLVFLLLFPRSVGLPKSLAGITYFNQRESRILVQRVLLDDPSKAEGRRKIAWAEVKRAVRYTRVHMSIIEVVDQD